MNTYFFRTISSLFLSILLCWQLIGPHLAAIIVYAADEIATESAQAPTPEPTATPAESPTPAPTPSPTPEPSISPVASSSAQLETGDATSSASVDTEANTTTLIGTSSAVPSCGIDLTLACAPESIENSADTSASSSAEANTGENTQEVAVDRAEVQTGDALSTAQSTTAVNTTEVVAPSPTPTPSPPILASFALPSPTPDSEPIVGPACFSPDTDHLSIDNSATVSAQTAALSDTGTNTISNISGDAALSSGQALAIASATNSVNNLLIDSSLTSFVLTVLSGQSGVIDLNAMWQQLVSSHSTQGLYTDVTPSSELSIDSLADVASSVSAVANTGENDVAADRESTLTTGNAVAIANATTLVNSILNHSSLLFGLINLVGDTSVDIIIPRPELFTQLSLLLHPASDTVIQNQANIAVATIAGANTGKNTQSGDTSTSLQTGNAYSWSSSSVLTNLSLSSINWFSLEILGQKPLDLESPASERLSGDTPTSPLSVKNMASVSTLVSAAANTGKNTQEGDSNLMTTGDAYSFARSSTIANSFLSQSNWFQTAVTVAGNWSGKVIVAYPEVSVALETKEQNVHPGDLLQIDATFANTGYDTAHNTVGSIQIPSGTQYESDTCSSAHTIRDGSLQWEFGLVAPDFLHRCTIALRVDPDFHFDQPIAGRSIIPLAYASEEQSKNLSIAGTVSTSDPQTNTYDDSVSIMTQVTPLQGGDVDSTTAFSESVPTVFVSATNNVNGFVRTADTVIFSLKARNTSGVVIPHLLLRTTLFTENGEKIGTHDIDTGLLGADQTKAASFSLRIPSSLARASATFITKTIAVGESSTGQQVSSNTAETSFDVESTLKLIPVTLAQTTLDTEGEAGQILGTSTEDPLLCRTKEAVLPYVLLFILCSSLAIIYLRTILREKSSKNRLRSLFIVILFASISLYALWSLSPLLLH